MDNKSFMRKGVDQEKKKTFKTDTFSHDLLFRQGHGFGFLNPPFSG